MLKVKIFDTTITMNALISTKKKKILAIKKKHYFFLWGKKIYNL